MLAMERMGSHYDGPIVREVTLLAAAVSVFDCVLRSGPFQPVAGGGEHVFYSRRDKALRSYVFGLGQRTLGERWQSSGTRWPTSPALGHIYTYGHRPRGLLGDHDVAKGISSILGIGTANHPERYLPEAETDTAEPPESRRLVERTPDSATRHAMIESASSWSTRWSGAGANCRPSLSGSFAVQLSPPWPADRPTRRVSSLLESRAVAEPGCDATGGPKPHEQRATHGVSVDGKGHRCRSGHHGLRHGGWPNWRRARRNGSAGSDLRRGAARVNGNGSKLLRPSHGDTPVTPAAYSPEL